MHRGTVILSLVGLPMNIAPPAGDHSLVIDGAAAGRRREQGDKVAPARCLRPACYLPYRRSLQSHEAQARRRANTLASPVAALAVGISPAWSSAQLPLSLCSDSHRRNFVNPRDDLVPSLTVGQPFDVVSETPGISSIDKGYIPTILTPDRLNRTVKYGKRGSQGQSSGRPLQSCRAHQASPAPGKTSALESSQSTSVSKPSFSTSATPASSL